MRTEALIQYVGKEMLRLKRPLPWLDEGVLDATGCSDDEFPDLFEYLVDELLVKAGLVSCTTGPGFPHCRRFGQVVLTLRGWKRFHGPCYHVQTPFVEIRALVGHLTDRDDPIPEWTPAEIVEQVEIIRTKELAVYLMKELHCSQWVTMRLRPKAGNGGVRSFAHVALTVRAREQINSGSGFFESLLGDAP